MSTNIINLQEALENLEAKKPPADVLAAARKCAQHMAAGISPPWDLVCFVTKWIGKHNSQDRYGK